MRFRFSVFVFTFFMAGFFITGFSVQAQEIQDTRGVRVENGEIVMGQALLQRKMREWERNTPRNQRIYEETINKMYEDEQFIEGLVDEARFYYAHSYDYTPFSKNIVERLTEHAFIADTSEDLSAVNDALFKYRDLLKTHLVNYDVLTYALSLARLDTKYGSASFLARIKKAIETSLTHGHNDGLSPYRAHHVASFGEENFLLRRHGGIVQDSEIYNVGPNFYNVHTMVGNDGREKQVYINITQPLLGDYLRRAIRARDQGLVLPAQ